MKRRAFVILILLGAIVSRGSAQTADRNPLSTPSHPLDPLTAVEIVRTTEVLSAAGRAKPPWQPPLDYAHALVREHPAVAELTKQLTELFYAARYGGKSLTGAELVHARSLVAQLRRKLSVVSYQ